MLNSPMLSIFQHFHAIPLRSPLISLRSKWRLTGFSRRFTPKNPVRLHKPFGQLPRWGAKNVLTLNLIVFPARGMLSIRGKPAVKRPSDIAPFRYPERQSRTFIPNFSFLIPHLCQSFIPNQEGSSPQANLKPKEPQKCGAFLWLFHSLSSTRVLLRVYPWSFLFRKVPSFQTCPGPGSHRSKRYGSVRKQLCP